MQVSELLDYLKLSTHNEGLRAPVETPALVRSPKLNNVEPVRYLAWDNQEL